MSMRPTDDQATMLGTALLVAVSVIVTIGALYFGVSYLL